VLVAPPSGPDLEVVAVGRHDAQRTILLENGQLHLLDRIEAVLAQGRPQVVLVQPLLVQGLGQPGPVSTDDRRLELEQSPDERNAPTERRHESIQDEDRDDDDRGARDRLVRPGDRGLEGICREQDKGQVEQGELADLAFPEDPQGRQKNGVDDDRPGDDLERREAELPHRRIVAHRPSKSAAGRECHRDECPPRWRA